MINVNGGRKRIPVQIPPHSLNPSLHSEHKTPFFYR